MSEMEIVLLVGLVPAIAAVAIGGHQYGFTDRWQWLGLSAAGYLLVAVDCLVLLGGWLR